MYVWYVRHQQRRSHKIHCGPATRHSTILRAVQTQLWYRPHVVIFACTIAQACQHCHCHEFRLCEMKGKIVYSQHLTKRKNDGFKQYICFYKATREIEPGEN